MGDPSGVAQNESQNESQSGSRDHSRDDSQKESSRETLTVLTRSEAEGEISRMWESLRAVEESLQIEPPDQRVA